MDRFAELREKILPILLPWGVKRIAPFGSVSRRDDRPGSDIDILVELKPYDERPPLGLKWFGLDEDLRRALGRDVDLVTENALSPYIRPYVEEDLVVLYEEDGQQSEAVTGRETGCVQQRGSRRDGTV